MRCYKQDTLGLYFFCFVLLTGCSTIPNPIKSEAPPPDTKEPKMVVVRPKVLNTVLNNPGIGFMTFQRFEGDKLDYTKNPSEGFPITYAQNKGSIPKGTFPKTKMAYFRLYWKFIEPKEGEFHWELIDEALKIAHERGQTLMLRTPPHGPDKESDVPFWYRQVTNELDLNRKFPGDPDGHLRVDILNPAYLKYYSRLIREFGHRFNGHPDIEAVDVSISGAWGEGSGTDKLPIDTKHALYDAYTETLTNTHLIMQITDKESFDYIRTKNINVGWRVDCLGDTKLFGNTWSHMHDYYPQQIVELGIRDNWQTSPVSMEVCGILGIWDKKNIDIDYIIAQSLKWHMSTFNAKSSPVPLKWRGKVDEWLKKMGYRFALRKMVFPAIIQKGEKFKFASWWENLGVAPPYRYYPIALRFKNQTTEYIWSSQVDVRKWLPGDALLNDSIELPKELTPGKYEVTIALLEQYSKKPTIQLASEGLRPDGWYSLGSVELK